MMQRIRRVALAATLAILPLTTGCDGFFVNPGSGGNGGSSTSTGDYVYVANSSTGTLAAYSVGSGTLTQISGSPYSLGLTPSANSMVVNKANTLLFVSGTNNGLSFINVYSIGSGGGLTLLKSNALGLVFESSIDVSPDGQWLMGLEANGTLIGLVTLDEFTINTSTGTLGTGTGTSFSFTGANIPVILPRQVRFAPNGQLVFAALGTAGDLAFNFTTSNGALGTSPAVLAPISTSTSENALVANPASSYLYIARSGTSGGLAAYTIGSNPVLTPVSGTPFTAATQPFSVAVNSTGTNVYVANQGSSSISGYSVASSGAVTPLSTSNSGTNVTALAIDTSGKYLLAAANGTSTDLWMYSFDSSGNPVVIQSITATGSGAVAIATTH